MTSIFRWIGIFAATAGAAAVLTWLLMWIGGYEADFPCAGLSPSDCVDAQALSLDRTALVATLVGIALSAIGTAALVVTIVYTSKATAAAVEAARAADHAVALARETAGRELRPYMAFDDLTMAYQSGDDGRAISWRVRVEWINTGATPAINVRAKTNHILVEGDLPDNFDFPDRPMNEAVGVVGREKKFRSPTADMTLEQVADVLGGRFRLFVWSWVEYEGFEGPRGFRSEWHSEISLWGVSDPADTELKNESLLRSRFNGTDNRCHRPPPGSLAAT